MKSISSSASGSRRHPCPHEHCSGKIEFDAVQLNTAQNTAVPSPQCGLGSRIFVPEQKVPPAISPEDFHFHLIANVFESCT
jgi:hypothetical protein